MAAGTQTLKRTPLYERHVAAGAKLVPFAGWEMPVQYAGIKEEHVAVRAHAGVNDVSRIAENGAQYSVLCKQDGGVLDDLFSYRLGDGHYLTVTNASNHEKDLAWFNRHADGF